MKRLISQISKFFPAVFDITMIAWRTNRLSFAGLLLIEILQGILPLGSAWIVKVLFDSLVKSFQAGPFIELPENLLLLLIAEVLITVITQISTHLGGYLNAELGRQLALTLQSQIFEKINSLQGLAPFETSYFHDAIQLATQGARYGPAQILDILTNLIRSVVMLVSFMGVLLVFSPLLAMFVVIAAAPQLYVQVKMGSQRFDIALQNTSKERLASYYGHVQSAVQFAKEVRLFNLSEYFLKAFRRLTIEIHAIQRNQQLREARWQSGLSLISSLVSAGVFAIVVLRAFYGGLSLGDVTLYTSTVSNIQAALYGIIIALATANESALFFAPYTKLLALPQPISIPLSTRPIMRLSSSIEFRNISFRYSEEHPWVLRNINLNLPAGECLALIGLNGAGKTTLVKLLTRMYDPSEGQILWNGIDIREFDPVNLRYHMGAIFQDFVRFDLTAYENIALGDVTLLAKDDDQIVEKTIYNAARKAGIHEVITELPQGYQTVLSRWLNNDGQGTDLSGGEWQKIALARMFVRDADVLILDEPTAALDAQTEYDVYCRFVELVAGKTSLLISHRFSTVRMADKIAVLENGRISEYGTHHQLLSLGGTYAKLYTMQANLYK